MGWLILIAILGTMVFFLYRALRVWQERFSHRDDDYDSARLMQLMQEDSAKPDVPPAILAPLPIPPVKATQPQHAAPAPQAEARPARRKLMDDAAQAAYLNLRSGVGDYPLLACVDIASLLDPHGPPPPRVQADFVICKKDFSPVVVILIERQPGDPMLTRAEHLLTQHRLRVLRWSAAAIPDRNTLREQIFKAKS